MFVCVCVWTDLPYLHENMSICFTVSVSLLLTAITELFCYGIVYGFEWQIKVPNHSNSRVIKDSSIICPQRSKHTQMSKGWLPHYDQYDKLYHLMLYVVILPIRITNVIFFPRQTSKDLAKKSAPICSCDIYVSTGLNPHYTDLT